ncbi:MAG: hypothetical protein L6290_03510 [Thermodesulfovibrionales bacterium]|nr:hypothetical protein [Thermodesulfovibrionales bacterium]
MPKFKDHFNHSQQRHPDIPEQRHKAVHQWMDNPANWLVNKLYESGFIRRRGRSGHDHRDIRHDPEKVANALGGGIPEVREQVRSIAKCHAELDGKLRPSIRHKITEANHFAKSKNFKDDQLIKVITSVMKAFRRKKI